MTIGDVDTSSSSVVHMRSRTSAETTLELSTKDNYNGSLPSAKISFTQQNGTEIARIKCDTNTGAANMADLTFWTNFGGLVERMRITKTGQVNIHSGSNALGSLRIGGNYDSTGTSNATAKLGMITMPHYTNAEEPIQIIRGYSDSSQSLITIGGGTSSANVATNIIFYASTSITGSATERLRINSDGGIQISTVRNVSATASNTTGSFNSAELILTTPVYAEYHYTWSGHSSYTIDLTCASYFHSEFIYVQHQTNGGSRMQQYVRGQWSNNHTQHSCKIWEDAGSGGGLSVSFVASDQSGGGAINGRSNLSNNGSTYSGFVNGGGESSSSTANGRLRISETYNWGSVSSRALIVRVYFGSFAISKS